MSVQASGPAFLPTVTPQPPAALPVFEEQEIAQAILEPGSTRQWATHILSGSFTAPGAKEWLGLVGNIGDEDEIRWAVVEPGEDGGRLLGVSEWLGSGFDEPPSFYLAPDTLDFDGDGRQELLHHYLRTGRGLTTGSSTIYRWDGKGLARIWNIDLLRDNREASVQDAPHPYRQNYRAEWEWVDLDENGISEVVVQEQVIFHLPDGLAVSGQETGTRVFCWDGTAFRPCRFDGPRGTFAYTVLGDLWLWQDHIARPLGERNVRDLKWSPDGMRLAWWSRPAPGTAPPELVLGIYDVATETSQKFTLALDGELEEGTLRLHWTPGGQLVYTLPGCPSVRFDPESGLKTVLPVEAAGDWSPAGNRAVYQRDGSLYIYDL
ncbi:MAG TPA: hypothetical protein ENN99_11595, partial [Chloroflexi bacterium]|nr:hypothetical protein [Chloroflexota bacterium]